MLKLFSKDKNDGQQVSTNNNPSTANNDAHSRESIEQWEARQWGALRERMRIARENPTRENMENLVRPIQSFKAKL